MTLSLDIALCIVMILLAFGWLPFISFTQIRTIRIEEGIKTTKEEKKLHQLLLIWLNVVSLFAIILSTLSFVTLFRTPEISVEEYRIASVEDETVYLENGETCRADDIKPAEGEPELPENTDISGYSVTVRTETKQTKFLFITEIAKKKEYTLHVPNPASGHADADSAETCN